MRGAGAIRSMLILLVLLSSLLTAKNAAAAEMNQEEASGQPDMLGMAEEYYEEMDFDEVQDIVDEVTGYDNSFQFKDYVSGFLTGGKTFSLKDIGGDMLKAAKGELSENKNTVVRLISIAIMAAIFTNFSNVFKSSQVAETGFYVTYLLMFTILASSFFSAIKLATETLSLLLDFMKVMIPAYFLTIAFTVGSHTSMVFYESTLIIITLVDLILIHGVIPAINIYFILIIVNNLSKEDMLSRFTELLELIIRWTVKTLLGAVIGFNVIQGMIVPAVDYVKKTTWMKAAGAIPGVGNALGTVTETVLGAGMLVKNAVGAAGLVVIVLICAIPLVKLVFYTVLYKFGTAVIQPVSDKRVLNCMNASVQAASLLLYTVGIGALLFLFTIAIVASGTNLK